MQMWRLVLYNGEDDVQFVPSGKGRDRFTEVEQTVPLDAWKFWKSKLGVLSKWIAFYQQSG